MKSFKSFILVAMLATVSTQAVDVAKNVAWCGDKVGQFGTSLMKDDQTQIITVGSVGAVCVAAYMYKSQAHAVCLDGHANSRVMYKSNLINMTYSDFIDTIAQIDNYSESLEFIKAHCFDYFFFCTSHSKINRFISLAQDLQRKNSKRADSCASKDNAILEKFAHNLIEAQVNIEKELITNAIDANKTANNMYSLGKVLDIINTLISMFGSKR